MKQKKTVDSLLKKLPSMHSSYIQEKKEDGHNPLLVVTDIERSVEFYKTVLGLHVIVDFGENKTLTGGLALQSLTSWKNFIGEKDILFSSNSTEIYFEEENFDKFFEKLEHYDIEYVHQVKEHGWGQRIVRIYDPDRHIIEIGEPIKTVCKRFSEKGMTITEITERIGIPEKAVRAFLK